MAMIKNMELPLPEVNNELATNQEGIDLDPGIFEVPEHVFILNGNCPTDKTNDCVWNGCQGLCND